MGRRHYNLLRSYYVLRGYELYDDIASGQSPGFHTLYALLLWPLGYGRVQPSPETFAAIESTGLDEVARERGADSFAAEDSPVPRPPLAAACLQLAVQLWQLGHYGLAARITSTGARAMGSVEFVRAVAGRAGRLSRWHA